MTTHTLTRFEHDLVSYLNCKDAHAVALADSLIEHGINTIDQFEDVLIYRNDEYTSRPDADFAEFFAREIMGFDADTEAGMCPWIVIDWQATWDCNLRYDFSRISIDDADYYIHNV